MTVDISKWLFIISATIRQVNFALFNQYMT